MRGFLIALQFLTSIPVKIKGAIGEKETASSMAFFPLVGLLIGAALALSYNILVYILPHAVVCAFILAINVALTGGLHIDGFIDTIDALASGADKKRMLEIMREGRPGAVGIAAAILLFLAQYSLLVSLPKGTIEASLITMAVLSRASFVVSSAIYPYAREGEGLGRRFAQRLGRKELWMAGLTALIVVAYIFKLSALLFILIVSAVILTFNGYIRGKVGGITGDTIGALGEIIETVSLALAVVLI